MKTLLVVPNPKKWHLHIAGVEVVSARKYVTEKIFSQMRGIRVFNLMHVYRYQSLGYYVSLLAEARGHKPVPSITTFRDLQTPAMVRMTSTDLQELIDDALKPIKSDRFTLSIYFGQNMAKRYGRLCREIFNRFHAHFLRVELVHGKGHWSIKNIGTISLNEVPESHFDFLNESANRYFSGAGYRNRKSLPLPYSMAILHRPGCEDNPSNEAALKKFIWAGSKTGLDVELITKDDFGRLREFDALFIRETTTVNNHTFRFARYAEAEGLVVVDDPQSIIRCANKVYLAEMMDHEHIRMPRTVIVHRDNIDMVGYQLGLPCILKRPDSSFSLGVEKVDTSEQLEQKALEMMDKSELIIAQEFLPTDYDWRVGIWDGQPLYVCRYYMAKNHWQIIHRDGNGNKDEGWSDTLAVEEAPPEVVKIALKAANSIGSGLYGVDIKQVKNRFYVIEVNDNPNIDAGVEDEVLKNDLYLKIMQGFRRRIELQKSM